MCSIIDITTKYSSFQLIVSENKITEAPSYAQWTIGKKPVDVIVYYMDKKAQVRMDKSIMFDPDGQYS
jgi:hypothetical protein